QIYLQRTGEVIRIAHSTRTILHSWSPAMAQPVSCPACNASFELSGEQLGRWVQCPQCRFGFAATSDEPPGQASSFPDELYQPAQRSLALPLLVLGSGAAVVVSLIVLVVVLNNREQPAPQVDRQAKAQEQPAKRASNEEPLRPQIPNAAD